MAPVSLCFCPIKPCTTSSRGCLQLRDGKEVMGNIVNTIDSRMIQQTLSNFFHPWNKDDNAEFICGLNEIMYVKPTAMMITTEYLYVWGIISLPTICSDCLYPRICWQRRKLYRTSHLIEYFIIIIIITFFFFFYRYSAWRPNQKSPLLSSSSLSLLSSQHGNIILSLPSRAEKMTPWQMKKIWNLGKEERWGESIGLWDMQSLLCCLSCGHYRCMGPYMWRRVPGNKLTKGRTPTPAPSLHMDSVEIGFYCFNLQWRMAEPD